MIIKLNTMKNASNELNNLFTEVVKIELSNYESISLNMLRNTIQHFANLKPFDNWNMIYWSTICHNAGIKYNN
jgi:hypothetical protein